MEEYSDPSLEESANVPSGSIETIGRVLYYQTGPISVVFSFLDELQQI